MDYSPYLIIILGFIAFILRYIFSSKDITCFEQIAGVVVIRATPYARLINNQNLKVEPEKIVKIQLAGTCISLFSTSNNAIDIWVDKKSVNLVLESAMKHFPHASLVKIDN